MAAIFAIDQQSEIAGCGDRRQRFGRHFSLRVEQRFLIAPFADDVERFLHNGLRNRVGRTILGNEHVSRHFVVPDGAIHGAAGRLILEGEEFFDLFVGPIERARGAGLFRTLAGQLQGRFNERIRLAFGRRRRDIHEGSIQ